MLPAGTPARRHGGPECFRRRRRPPQAGAWRSRYPSKVSRHLQLRLEKLPAEVQAIAWKAQVRLCKRYRQMTARGTRLSCHRFRANEVRLLLGVVAYNLGNLLRRLALPLAIQSWSLTSLQQRLFKTGGRLIRHARYYQLPLAESHLTRRLFSRYGRARTHGYQDASPYRASKP